MCPSDGAPIGLRVFVLFECSFQPRQVTSGKTFQPASAHSGPLNPVQALGTVWYSTPSSFYLLPRAYGF